MEVSSVLEDDQNLTTERYKTNLAGDAVHTGTNVNTSGGKASPALPDNRARGHSPVPAGMGSSR